VSLAIIQPKLYPIKSQKWLRWLRPLVAGYRQYLHFVGRPLKPPP